MAAIKKSVELVIVVVLKKVEHSLRVSKIDLGCSGLAVDGGGP